MEERKFPSFFPNGCPPKDAVGKEITLFRLCRDKIPCENDFVPHILLYPKKEYRAKALFMACGLSTFPSVEDCKNALAKSPKLRAEMNGMAFGTVNEHVGKTLNTPNPKNPNHITWWVYEGVKPHTFFESYCEGGAEDG